MSLKTYLYNTTMNQKKNFFAVDLGATSGRTIVGHLEDGKFDMEELTRFDNALIETGGHFYWDIYALYNEIVKGLKIVAQRGMAIQSIGIDTWGCDFVCVGKDKDILRNPLAYRDPHTTGMMEQYFEEQQNKKCVYAKTGIQFMNFNSLFQLYAMRKAGNTALEGADKILFIPDALSYMLTGHAVCEYTVASTSQILNPTTTPRPRPREEPRTGTQSLRQDDHSGKHHRHTDRRSSAADRPRCRTRHRRGWS